MPHDFTAPPGRSVGSSDSVRRCGFQQVRAVAAALLAYCWPGSVQVIPRVVTTPATGTKTGGPSGWFHHFRAIGSKGARAGLVSSSSAGK